MKPSTNSPTGEPQCLAEQADICSEVRQTAELAAFALAEVVFVALVDAIIRSARLIAREGAVR